LEGKNILNVLNLIKIQETLRGKIAVRGDLPSPPFSRRPEA